MSGTRDELQALLELTVWGENQRHELYVLGWVELHAMKENKFRVKVMGGHGVGEGCIPNKEIRDFSIKGNFEQNLK